jgi:EAL domain-containing protein (putative c-di-GMP-specific phosphodiesterase class I)
LRIADLLPSRGKQTQDKKTETIISSNWYLEGAAADGNVLVVDITAFPFVIGKSWDCQLVLVSPILSRRHARIDSDGGEGLRIEDLGSTNGTFLNRVRIEGPRQIESGDILHFGTSEFRLKRRDDDRNTLRPFGRDEDDDRTLAALRHLSLPQAFALKEAEFLELLAQDLVCAAFQPIVSFENRETVAYEVLGRGRHPAIPASPLLLYSIAASLNKEVELSEAFRRAGARSAVEHGIAGRLFINAHPKEIFGDLLYASLDRVRQLTPAVEVVLEVPEKVMAAIDKMKAFSERLRDMDIGLAYDDFGAGQSRINELAEVPARFVKFDISLIHNIQFASEKKQQVVSRLVSLVHELGSVALAEGVETEAEAQVCKQMGFDLCQGYLTGRPMIR